MSLPLPRYVIAKPLKSGKTAFYYNVPRQYLNAGCPRLNQPLGTDYVSACGADGGGGTAANLNGRFDEWYATSRGIPVENPVRVGTVDWLFRTYKSSKAYLEKVSERSRPDYDLVMQMVAGVETKTGDKVGNRLVRNISPAAADKIYDKVIQGKKGERLRQGEKAVKLCSKAWRVVYRLHPEEFDRRVPDPWAGVTLKRRTKKTKPHVTREDVYKFAWGCIEKKEPEPAAAAVICYEWLQRPENVLSGKIRWSDYRSKDHPNQIRIEHHKTGKMVLHPLEDMTEEGLTLFYEEAESVLSHLPKRGVSMILREIEPSRRDPNRPKVCKPFSRSGFAKMVQRLRKDIGLPLHFTLDACRHGGMTELEEAELTDGQGRALSAHTSKAYDGYAKRTEKRALAATRKRHAHVIANKAETSIQNGTRTPFRTENGAIPKQLKKQA